MSIYLVPVPLISVRLNCLRWLSLLPIRNRHGGLGRRGLCWIEFCGFRLLAIGLINGTLLRADQHLSRCLEVWDLVGVVRLEQSDLPGASEFQRSGKNHIGVAVFVQRLTRDIARKSDVEVG